MSSTNPLTPAEQAWANANADKIRQMMQHDAPAPSVEPTVLDPVASAARDMIAHIKKQLKKIEREHGSKQERLERYGRMPQPFDEDTAEYVVELQTHLAKYQQHADALNAKIKRLEASPREEYLPIGTVVRFEDVPDYENSLSLSDDRKSYPVAGSVGVVTGLKHQSEHGIAVGMRREFKDGWGYTYDPDYDRFPVYMADRSMLTVIGYGKLPDGSDYEGYGFLPTHKRTPDKIDPDRQEMVLECDGHFWRFHDFGGTQSIEALQAYEDIAEMTWLEGPLDEFASASGPKL